MSCEPNKYLVGNKVRLTATFEDLNGVVVAPSIVKLIFKNSAGDVTTWVYGVDSELMYNAGTKQFSAEVLLDMTGSWVYRWESAGTYLSASEGVLIATASKL